MARLSEKGDKDHLLELRLQIVRDIDPFHSKGAPCKYITWSITDGQFAADLKKEAEIINNTKN